MRARPGGIRGARRPEVACATGVLGALAALAGAPAPATAQELGTDCELPEFRVLESTTTARGFRIVRVQGPFLLVCPDGVRIRADSAVVYEETGRNELMGRVRFDSPERELRAREADYFEASRRLHARGNVVFRDLARGTEVTGDTLVHLEATELRPREEVDVRGRPARAVLPREDLPPDEADPDPYRVSGDRLRFEGEEDFRADGGVEVRREGMRAVADRLVFDRRSGDLTLTGGARVEGEEGDFEGDRIVMRLPGDVLEEVEIHERGAMRTPDLDLRGEEIRVWLVEERIQRLVAFHPDGAPESRPRPRAVSEDFVLEGDSLDALTPDERLETVHAVGRARAETRGRVPGSREADLARTEPLAGVPEDPVTPASRSLLERDFIEGAEIVATFVEVESEPVEEAPARPDDAEPRREYRLETLTAAGGARSLYRAPPEGEDGPLGDAPLEEWTLSYVLADRIAIFLREGEVERMEAEGQVRILHLEPGAAETVARAGPGGRVR